MRPICTRIDGVNYVRRKVPTANGTIELEGLTIRALIKALSDLDPDDLVCYMAENTPETREADLLLGVIAAVGGKSNCGTVFLFGPEGVRAMKEGGMI